MASDEGAAGHAPPPMPSRPRPQDETTRATATTLADPTLADPASCSPSSSPPSVPTKVLSSDATALVQAHTRLIDSLQQQLDELRALRAQLLGDAPASPVRDPSSPSSRGVGARAEASGSDSGGGSRVSGVGVPATAFGDHSQEGPSPVHPSFVTHGACNDDASSPPLSPDSLSSLAHRGSAPTTTASAAAAATASAAPASPHPSTATEATATSAAATASPSSASLSSSADGGTIFVVDESEDVLPVSLKPGWQRAQTTGPVPKPRCWPAHCVVGNHLVVHGGYSGSNQYFTDVSFLDCRTLAWGTLTPSGSPPRNRYAHTIDYVSDLNALVLLCGGTGRTYFSDVFILRNLNFKDTPVWEKGSTTGKGPTRRGAHATAVVGSMIYLFGGDNGNGGYFNDLYRLDVDKMHWQKLKPQGHSPKPRGWHTMTSSGSLLFVFGGTDGTNTFNNLFVFDTETCTWIQPDVTGKPVAPRYSHSAIMVGNELLVFGGSASSTNYNDCFIYDTNKSGWVFPTMCGDVPSPRYGHVGARVGSRMFLFGGYSGTTFTNDLFILSLGIDEPQSLRLDSSVVNNMINDYRSMLDSSLFTDVTFRVEGRLIGAHRAVLSSRCDHFQRMFNSPMRESQIGVVVEIDDVSYDIFKRLLEFLYTGYCPVSKDNAVELLMCSDLFGVDELKSLCESVLISNVDISNLLTVYQIAARYGAKQLQAECLSLIKSNRSLLSASSSIIPEDLSVVFLDSNSS